jgi:hypothetical protein
MRGWLSKGSQICFIAHRRHRRSSVLRVPEAVTQLAVLFLKRLELREHHLGTAAGPARGHGLRVARR